MLPTIWETFPDTGVEGTINFCREFLLFFVKLIDGKVDQIIDLFVTSMVIKWSHKIYIPFLATFWLHRQTLISLLKVIPSLSWKIAIASTACWASLAFILDIQKRVAEIADENLKNKMRMENSWLFMDQQSLQVFKVRSIFQWNLVPCYLVRFDTCSKESHKFEQYFTHVCNLIWETVKVSCDIFVLFL